jgi:hypothetical protein
MKFKWLDHMFEGPNFLDARYRLIGTASLMSNILILRAIMLKRERDDGNGLKSSQRPFRHAP